MSEHKIPPFDDDGPILLKIDFSKTEERLIRHLIHEREDAMKFAHIGYQPLDLKMGAVAEGMTIALSKLGASIQEATLAFEKLAEVGKIHKTVILDSLSPLIPLDDLAGLNAFKKELEPHPGGKNYARKQAAFWANKPNHKLKRRL